MGLAALTNWLVRSRDALADIDDLGGGELRDVMKLHVVGAETLDKDLAGSIDRNLDDVGIIEKLLERCERAIEKVMPIVGDKLSGGHVHVGSPSALR